MTSQKVLEKLESLPAEPGCYLFKADNKDILYIGKAKSLRNRVRSYFQEGSSDQRALLPLLLQRIDDLETVVVGTEKEAAILENLLIKQHKPPFNVKLRDDKEFPLLRLDPAAEWPRLEIVRKPQSDKARYFGPYPSSSNARRALHLVNRFFQLRTCTDTEMAARKRPCLQYQIKRCPAPCVLDVDHDAYDAQVEAVSLFLQGRHDELAETLDARMRVASQSMEYEQAAIYRDQIRAVASVQQQQRVVGDKDIDQDVVGLFREGDLVELTVLFVRRGAIRDTASFSLSGVEIPDDEVVAAFIRQMYDLDSGAIKVLPDEVLLPVLPDGVDGTAELLSERKGKKVTLARPQRGRKFELLSLANTNAAHAYKEKRREGEDVLERLGKLQRKLRLAKLPRRIECVDISHHQGSDTVGAVVCLVDGKPERARYRVFKVRSTHEGDDYAAMYEVLARRFRRGREAQRHALNSAQPAPVREAGAVVVRAETTGLDVANELANDVSQVDDTVENVVDELNVDWTPTPAEVASESLLDQSEDKNDLELQQAEKARSERVDENAEPEPTHNAEINAQQLKQDTQAPQQVDWVFPDLLVVDGGRGQLRVALTAAKDLGIKDLAIIGLAKERENVGGELLVDRVYLPGQKNGIPLKPQSAALFFLARARDEAHRASNKARESLAKKRVIRSELDEVPGIGPKIRVALLKAFGSVEAVVNATDEQLLAVPGVSRRVLNSLKKHFEL